MPARFPQALAMISLKQQPIPNPQLWSPDNPYLYQVHTIIQLDGKELDRVTTRLGIRWSPGTKRTAFF